MCAGVKAASDLKEDIKNEHLYNSEAFLFCSKTANESIKKAMLAGAGSEGAAYLAVAAENAYAAAKTAEHCFESTDTALLYLQAAEICRLVIEKITAGKNTEYEFALLKGISQSLDAINKASFASIEREAEKIAAAHGCPAYEGVYSPHLLKEIPLYTKGKEKIGVIAALQRASDFLLIIYEKKQTPLIESETDDLYIIGNKSKGFVLEITKKGGEIQSFKALRDFRGRKKTADFKKAAEDFLKKAGYLNMHLLKSEAKEGSVLYTFIYKNNDIIFYPDKITVAFSEKSGKIVGFSAKEYIKNHGERSGYVPEITEDKAKSAIKSENIARIRKAVIINDKGEEAFCYEIAGEGFCVYVNCQSGAIEKIALTTKTAFSVSG